MDSLLFPPPFTGNLKRIFLLKISIANLFLYISISFIITIINTPLPLFPEYGGDRNQKQNEKQKYPLKSTTFTISLSLSNSRNPHLLTQPRTQCVHVQSPYTFNSGERNCSMGCQVKFELSAVTYTPSNESLLILPSLSNIESFALTQDQQQSDKILEAIRV